MRKIITGIFLFPLLLLAQVNESDTLKLKADLSATGFWQGGNVETVIFRAKSSISFQPYKKWVFKTQNSYVYQEFGRIKADEDILSLNFLYVDPSRKIYPLLLGFVSTNFRREIALRSLLGLGLTFKLVEKKNNWLKCSISSEYEQTRFKETNFNLPFYSGSTEINTFRGTVWLSGRWQLLEKKVIATHEFYFQPSLERRDNFRWQADLGLELPIWKFFNFKINYLHTFESIVIAGQQREDSVLTFGFSVKSY